MKERIIRHYKYFYPEKLNFSNDFSAQKMKKGFVLKLRLKEKPDSRKMLFSIPGAVDIYCDVFEKGVTELSRVQNTEQYFVYAKDGKSPVLEIKLNLNYPHHPDWKEMILGIPLNKFDIVNEDLYIVYDGLHLRFIYKNEIINENWPIGELCDSIGEPFVNYESLSFFGVSHADIPFEEKEKTYDKSFRYYSPFGYNEWVGDITNFYHDGVYHFMFLNDRHNHGNRFRCGAHWFSHVTTKDFCEWHDYGAVLEFKEQWQTMGTGNMHFKDGKYYLTYGWHTDRAIPKDKVGNVLLAEELEKTAQIPSLPFDEIYKKGFYPSGATYVYSEDGIHFTPAERQIHISENPSVYIDSDGRLLLFAGYNLDGIWVSDSIDGPWKRHTMILPSETHNPVGASTECPSYFEWNGYKYLIMGFVGFWQTEKDSDEFTDMAERGFDIYDGLNVPMVTNCDGRYIMSGWIRKKKEWAFLAVHRELVQEENGRLKLRWLEEFTPQKEDLYPLEIKNQKASLQKGKSYYFETEVAPETDAVLRIRFEGEGTPFELKLDTLKEKAQMGYLDSGEILPMDEKIKTLDENYKRFYQCEDDVHWITHNFAIKNVEELKENYTVKGILYYEEKEGCNVLDIEISGKRTMISVRDDFVAESVSFISDNANINRIEIFEMQ